MAKREWNGSSRIWIGVLGGAVILAVLLALAVQGMRHPPSGPEGESSSLPESSISEPASGEESSDPEQDESSESSSEASSQPEKTDKITITQAGEYAGIDPMKQVVIRAGEVTVRDMIITGDLFIMDGVSGDVTLENVTIGGNLYVYGSDLLTLDSVKVPSARFQRDNQPVNVMVKGDSQIDNTLMMCSGTLRERGLGRSEGLVNMQVENGGLLIKNNVSLLSVHLDQLTVNYNSRISLSSGSEVKQADANAKLALAGLGKVKDLVVRSDYVQYTVEPDNITVKRGFDDPVKVDPEYDVDEDGHPTLLDTESLQLPAPEEVLLYEEDGYLCLEYSHVEANDGYYVVVYKGSDRLVNLYTDVDEEELILTEMDPSWQGKRFYAKVKALGSVYDSTVDSEFGDSETFRWE